MFGCVLGMMELDGLQWISSIVIPIYKNKDDTQSCRNYKGIKILRHTMKLWERVLKVFCVASHVFQKTNFV